MNQFSKPYLSLKADRAITGTGRLRYGVSYLDDALSGIFPTDLILLGARTGVGKTQIATQVALANARAGKNVYFFALEAEHGEIEDRLCYREACRLYYEAFPPVVASDYVTYAAYRAAETPESFELCVERTHRSLAVYTASLRILYRDKKFTVDDFVRAFEGVKDDADLIIVDHLHYFDLEDENEQAGLKSVIRKIRSAALDFKKPILLLAHLRKTNPSAKNELPDIDEFYGHSDLVKIATNVILTARAENTDAGLDGRGTYIYIPKSRFCPEAYGYAGILNFNLRTGAYDEHYHLAKVRRFSEPELIGSRYEFPRWAKHAKEIQNLTYRAGNGVAAIGRRAPVGKEKAGGTE